MGWATLARGIEKNLIQDFGPSRTKGWWPLARADVPKWLETVIVAEGNGV
jgi:hypothetical protein